MNRIIPLLFILLGCLLLTGGAALIGTAFLFRPADVPNPFDWAPPPEQVEIAALAPATVILPLTGIDSLEALNEALDSASIEDAYALIAYDPNLTDPARIGALLQIGARYASAKQTRKAAGCYQAAALLATLSPAISDPAREDTYLQAGAGLRTIGATDAARMVIDQAYLVAQSSPALRRESRARRLNQVADAYTALGVSSLAAQAHSKGDESLTEPTESATAPVRVPFDPTAGKLPVSTEVDQAVQTRIAAAQQLADDLKGNPPKRTADWPNDSVSQLGDALVAEDAARQSYYDQQTAIAKDPAVQLALWRDRAGWLALKYRTARGAFGINLVSDWSKDAKTIEADWGDAWNQVYNLQQAQAAALPKAEDVTKATEDVQRRQLIAARWGWLSGVNEQDLRDALAETTLKLRDNRTTDLFVDTLTRNGKTIYLLVPDESYGLNEKALPK